MDEHIQNDTYINVLENTSCNVCYNDFHSNEIITTNCGHNYCENCLLTWFRRGKISCPICIQDVDYYIKDNEKNHIIKIINQNNPITNNPITNNRVTTNNVNNTISRNNNINGNYLRVPKWKFYLLRYALVFNMSLLVYLQYMDIYGDNTINYNNCSG